MKVNWDYSQMANSYQHRPNYCARLITEILLKAGLNHQSRVCDVGAGTGHLTRLMAPQVKQVIAVEPNRQMRQVGIKACGHYPNVFWQVGTGEQTGLPADGFNLVSFGSSFNVVNPNLALAEAKRISSEQGWVLAVWNHRDLTTPLQSAIETHIKQTIPSYAYGERRQDPTDVLMASDLFRNPWPFESRWVIKQQPEDMIKAWHSHATLKRQAGDRHAEIIRGISEIISHASPSDWHTPYNTRAWLAQFK